MRIVFATAEVSPIAKTGGLGDVCGSLPKELRKLGHDVVVFMPYYRQARQYFERNGIQPEPLIPTAYIRWGNWWADLSFLRTTLPGSDVPLILVANDYYFDREQIYSTFGATDDFLQRFTVFSRGVIRGCELLGIQADILHAHDWHTALLPLYLDSGLRGTTTFAGTRCVFTVHNLNYQGVADADAFTVTGLHGRYWAPDAVEHFGQVNPMKGGILFADQVTTVSPNYAIEIQTPAIGAGLDGVLRSVSQKLTGILNGIDVEEWDPAADPDLEANFEIGKMHGKTISKRMLAREAGLKYKPRTPILSVVSRLVDQKGFQLLLPVMSRMLQAGAQAVVLGSGESLFEDGFRSIEAAHPDACRVWIGFDNSLAHRIYAGSDMLLMPSIYEPCGLNQMYALRYGTLPVARMTGGLVDTVIPYDGTNKGVANGFGFGPAATEALYFAAWAGMLNYKDVRLWKTLQHNGMEHDFSWSRSAAEYEAVYRRALLI